jgi:hypothetical protein
LDFGLANFELKQTNPKFPNPKSYIVNGKS